MNILSKVEGRSPIPRHLFLPVVMAISFLLFGAGSVHSQGLGGNLDLVVVVDTSKTMRGLAGGANIFPQVKQTVKEFVHELTPGDTITLASFDSVVKLRPTITLLGETERGRFDAVVDEMAAEGDWTFTAEALRLSLAEASRLEKAFPNHTQVLVILTDGINDPPPGVRGNGPSLQEITQVFSGKPWYVYQVQLGPKVDSDLEEALKKFPNGRTIQDTRGAHLSELPRKVLPPPKPTEVVWKVAPERLNLRLVEVAKPVAAETALEFPQGLPPAALAVDLKFPSLPAVMKVGHELVSNGDGKARIKLTAQVDGKLGNGLHEGRLVITLKDGTRGFSAKPLEIPVRIETAVMPPTWPYWLGALAALGALVGAAFLVKRSRDRKQLFGRLECWPAERPAEVVRFDNLESNGSQAQIGSSQIILPGVTSSLARLSAGMSDGEKHVVVTSIPPARLTMSGRTMDELTLFDRDVFEITGWVFRYRGEVSVRRR